MSKSAKAKKTHSKTKSVKEVKYRPYFIHYFYCLAIIGLLILTSLNINNFFVNQKVLGVSIDVSELQNEKIYWQEILKVNPSYIDAYLQLAKVNIELGNKNEAENYIKEALSLDPNSSKITEVATKLGL